MQLLSKKESKGQCSTPLAVILAAGNGCRMQNGSNAILKPQIVVRGLSLAERSIAQLQGESLREPGGSAMPDAVSWATPLLVLPGVGLLLVSTSARYEAIHAEIHQLLDDPSEQAIGCTLHVVHRARILRLAMLSLYVSASLLAASGLIAALTVGFLGAVHWASVVSAG